MFWSQASQYCRRAGAHLPEFYSRTDQELLAILKEEIHLFPMEAIFIGLKT